MSEHPTEPNRAEEDDPRRQAERERAAHDSDGKAADVGAVPGEKPKDDPDEEGEDRFDAG
ncbi:hypothetical protein [Isoptericola sp. NPDC019482]|uniref:hypothetical protein n=1 Tax=Isoptericola sp. NPDC019482 TaxID=3154688 RepID=UPI00347228A2